MFVGTVFLFGGVFLGFDRKLHLTRLPNFWTLLVLGAIGGAIGVFLATLVEVPLWHALGFDQEVRLWLAGFVEETFKLLVPVILFLTVANFRNPRGGFVLVYWSAAVFGAWECLTYINQAGVNGPLIMGIGRPLAELQHPLLTVVAGVVIWLAARRQGRLVTWAGVLSWVFVMVVHSLHDGLLSLVGRGNHSLNPEVVNYDTGILIGDAIASGIIINGLWIVIYYFFTRHVAREIVPPSAVESNPPGWRPRLQGVGLPKGPHKHHDSHDSHGPHGKHRSHGSGASSDDGAAGSNDGGGASTP